MAVRPVVPGMPTVSLAALERQPRVLRPPLAAPPRFAIPKVPAAKAPTTHPSQATKITASKPERPLPRPSKTALGIAKSQQTSSSIPVISSSYLGHKSSASSGPTADQLLQLYIAQHQQHSKGFLDQVEGGITGTVGSILHDALNILARPSWAVAGAAETALNHPLGSLFSEHGIGRTLSAAEAGFAGRTHHSFGEILKEHGWLNDHTLIRGGLGLGLDIATDPTNLLLIAATPFTGGLSAEAFLVKEGLLKGLGEVGTRATVKDLIDAAGTHGEVWDRALAETKFGQKPLGEVTAEDISKMTDEELAKGIKAMQMSHTFKLIRDTAIRWQPRKVDFGLWLPTLMGGRRLMLSSLIPGYLRFMPYAPNMLRIAEGLTPISRIPGVAPMARTLAHAFKPGWEDPIAHAAKMGAKHTAEAVQNHLSQFVHGEAIASFAAAAKTGLSKEAIYHAFDVATREGAAHEHNDLTRTLNEAFLREHGLDSKQVDFIRTWNNAMNRQVGIEHMVGVQTHGLIGDRVYVPYRIEEGFGKGGFRVVGGTKTFQHARAGERGLKELMDLVDRGEVKGVITDPHDLFKARVIQGAQAMSHSVWRAGMTDLFGIPLKVVDPERAAELTGRVESALGAVDEHQALRDMQVASHNDQLALHDTESQRLIAEEGNRIDEQVAAYRRQAAEHEVDQAAAQRARTAAQAQARVAKKGVGQPLRHVLTGLMKKAENIDDLKKLWAEDAKSALDATDKQVALGRKQVYERTQASLEARGYPEQMVVYGRARPGKGVQTFTLDRTGSQSAYLVDRKDILADGKAFFGGKDQVLVNTSQVEKTAARDIAKESDILAKQREVKNLRDQAGRAGKNISEEMLRSFGLADQHLQYLDQAAAENAAEGVDAGLAREEQRALDRELDSARKALAENDRIGQALATKRTAMQDVVENGAAQLAAHQQEAFTRAQANLLEWARKGLADAGESAKAEARMLGPAERRVQLAETRVKELTNARGGKLIEPVTADGLDRHMLQDEIDEWKQEIESNKEEIQMSSDPEDKAFYREQNADLRDAIKEHQASMKELAARPKKYGQPGKLTAAEKKILDDAKVELRRARADLKKIRERTTYTTEEGQTVKYARQRAAVGIKEVRDIIARSFQQRWERIDLFKRAYEMEHNITEEEAHAGSEAGRVFAAANKEQLRLKNLEARASSVRMQTTKSGEKISAESQLLDIVKGEGKEYTHLIDEIARIGKGRRVDVVDTPEMTQWREVIDQVEKAKTGRDLEKIAPGHEAMDAFDAGGTALMDAGEAVRHVNTLTEQINELADQREALLVREQEARAKSEAGRQENASRFKQSDEFKQRAKARYQEERRLRGLWQRSLQRIERLHEHHADVRARGQKAAEELHAMGGVEHPTTVRHHQRSITSLHKQADALETGKEARIQRITDRRAKGRERLANDLSRSRDLAASRAETLRRELIDAQLKAADGAWKRNPRIDAPGDGGQGFRTVDGIDGFAFPQKVADHLSRVEQVIAHPEGLEEVFGKINRLMAKWKMMVTVLNPGGYRIRNTISDIWNMYLNGMPLRAIPFYFVKAHRLLLKAKTDPRAEGFLLAAEFHGVMQGLFRGDVDHAYQLWQREGKFRTPIGWAYQKWVRLMTGANTHAENTGRLAHLLWRMDHSKTGLRGPAESFERAAYEVKRSHFDYEDLTDFEKRYAKALMPFYTWTRKNVPYQFAQMIQRPGRVNAFTHVVQESEFAADGKSGELTPPFFADSGAFRVPGIGPHMYYMPNIGLMDIARISSVHGIEGMLNPVVQLTASVATNHNLFTGHQIQSDYHGRDPVNPQLAEILSSIPIVSGIFDVGMTRRTTPSGGHVYSTGADPYALYVLQGLGIPELRTVASINPIDERHSSWMSRLSAQFGFPLQYANQEQEKQQIDIQAATNLQLILDNLKANNPSLESPAQKKSAWAQAVSQAQYAAAGRP